MKREKNRRDGLSRTRHGSDGSDRKGCDRLDIENAFAEMSGSSDSESARKGRGRVDFSSEHPPMALVEAATRLISRANTTEKCNEYARSATATHIFFHKKGTGGSGKKNVTVRSAEPFFRQRMEDLIGSAGENFKLRECRQRWGNTRLHGLYYRLVRRGNNVLDCAALRKMILTAREVLSHRALDSKLSELGKQEQKNRKELVSKEEELKNARNAAKRTSARPEGDVQGTETSQGTKRRTGKRESSRSSGEARVQGAVQR